MDLTTWRLFALFIKSSSAPLFHNWTNIGDFGHSSPDADDPQKCSPYAHLDVSDENEASLFAAVKGILSTHPPTGFLVEVQELVDEEADDDAQQTVTLYLTPDVNKLDPDYVAALDPFEMASSNLEQAGFSPASSRDTLRCFVYFNVDMETLRANVGPLLKQLPRGNKKVPTPSWKNFLKGRVNVHVSTGSLLGKAGQPYLPAQTAASRQVGFGIITKCGVYDPGAFYDSVQDVLINADKPLLHALRDDLLGIHWPLISNTALPANVGSEKIFPYTALLQYKNDKQLSYADWRAIGTRQKALYLARLTRRVRPDISTAPDAPRFTFDMADARNIFQLEAVTQFYVNLPVPWDLTKSPKAPGDDGFREINLLALYGNAAAISNREITLDGMPDMQQITPGLDVIMLDGDMQKQYRITAVDAAAKKVKVDTTPTITGPVSWHISHRPALVLIDAFGYRVQGETAVSAGGDKIKLQNLTADQKTHLKKINTRFDTISLYNTTSPFYHEFRIKAISIPKNQMEATITVDENGPTPLIGDPTPWHIPAGVGGQQGAVKRPLNATKKGYNWWDHYDGMMFVVINGLVEGTIPWSSYTSRKGKGSKLTSIKGNQPYFISSYLSTKHSFIFKVVDQYSHITGTQATKVGTTPKGQTILQLDYPLASTFLKQLLYWYNTKKDTWAPRKNRVVPLMLYSSPDDLFKTVFITLIDEANNHVILTKSSEVPDQLSSWRIIQYDGVHEAHNFFDKTTKSDTAPADKVPPFGKQALGKGLIRLHTGYINGNGSEGCLVSPYYADLRNLLVQHHLVEYAFYYKDRPNLTAMQNIRSKQKLPPAFETFAALNDKLGKYKAELSEWTVLKGAIEGLLADGVDREEEFEQLLYLLGEIFELSEVGEDYGDDFDEEIFSRSFENIFQILNDEEIQALLYAGELVQDETLRRFKYLEQEINTLKQKLANERQRLAWDNILMGTLWLIRPDERPVGGTP